MRRGCREGTLDLKQTSKCDLVSRIHVLSQTAGRLEPDFALREIALQGICRAGLVGESNVAVRPDEVERVLRETGLAVLRMPCELMESQAVLSAP